MRLHRIFSAELRPLSASSKLNAQWQVLRYRYETGRRAADEFCENHLEDVGVRDTLDLATELD